MAQAVVATVTEAVPDHAVHRVALRVGVLCGVVPEALTFAWDVVTAGTALEGSDLVIDRIPVSVSCRGCGAGGALEQPLPIRCPACGGLEVTVTGGQELEISTVELAEADAPTGEP
jgi:hydrogenase nickel incorporation protein HypA/HybF